MKVLLITPSNISHMPYIQNYIEILKDSKTEYTIINWDRLQIEPANDWTYKDESKSIGKTFLQYFRFSLFIKKKIKNENYDTIVIFGLQLLFFLQFILNKKKVKYILDIRDKNKILNFINLKSVLKKFEMIVISSEAYKEWLPNFHYFINHNTSIGIAPLKKIENKKHCNENDKIIITSLGSLRDFEANYDFIQQLGDNELYEINYYGDGDIWDKLSSLTKQYSNVFLYGRYQKKDEIEIGINSTFINVLRYPDSENNRTALPNRLYLAVELRRPLISLEGTYLSDVVEEYELGLVIKNISLLDEEITEYLKNFDFDKYEKNCKKYINKIEQENKEFTKGFYNVIREEK
ncbi:glycosyltransferase family protein [Vagococcus fluvialis]|uniref:hypothetical protein n=1 Tax=Vagococcus fluvialis TaxID=2738 RepID=UPI001D0B5FA2|nr:hypothetical protein [Vagococcus fluvialis]UDM73876.1 hypothetical protein K5K99_13345 [Vagococcus fluvialis]